MNKKPSKVVNFINFISKLKRVLAFKPSRTWLQTEVATKGSYCESLAPVEPVTEVVSDKARDPSSPEYKVQETIF